MRVAINGFGRIGKLVLRAYLERKIKGINIVAINELGSLESSFHLLKFDSTHGYLSHDISLANNYLKYSNKKIFLYSESNPINLPWKKLDVDVVLECSGAFTSKEKSQAHIEATLDFCQNYEIQA